MSKKLADDVLECLIKIGLSGHINQEKNINHPIYSVSVNRKFLTPRTTIRPLLVDYNGVIWDVTVPNHVLMVRRNGNPVWSGNSFGKGMKELIEAASLIKD